MTKKSNDKNHRPHLDDDFDPSEDFDESPGVLQTFPDIESISKTISQEGKGHKPNNATRQLVKNLAACGIPRETIAKIFGVRKSTLEKHYEHELEVSMALATSQLAARAFERAMRDDDKMSAVLLMFWLKSQAGWRDQGPVEVSGPDGGPIPMSTVKERLVQKIKQQSESEEIEEEDDN